MANVRTVKTASGATADQIVHSNRRGAREIDQIGSAHSPGEVEVLKTVAQQRLHANQNALDFLRRCQLDGAEAPIVASPGQAAAENPHHGLPGPGAGPGLPGRGSASWLDAIRVLEELGIAAPSYPTIKRRLPAYATQQWRQQLAAACLRHVGSPRTPSSCMPG